jgi:hypothetical protein
VVVAQDARKLRAARMRRCCGLSMEGSAGRILMGELCTNFGDCPVWEVLEFVSFWSVESGIGGSPWGGWWWGHGGWRVGGGAR